MTEKIEKVSKGYYSYRGVRIFKDGNSGFAFRYATHTDRYNRSDASMPVPLKDIAKKIDDLLALPENSFVAMGRIVFDSRTKVGA